MRAGCKMVCSRPCYVDANNAARFNPYRLTVAVREDGAVALLAEGNGNGDDLLLDEGAEEWAHLDADALRDNAEELRAAGFVEAADWIAERAEEVGVDA